MDPILLAFGAILGANALEQTPPSRKEGPHVYTALCEEFRRTADPALAADWAQRRLKADPSVYVRSRRARRLPDFVAPAPTVSPAQLRRELGSVQILDVRATPELTGPLPPLPGSVHVPIHKLELGVPRTRLDSSRRTVVVCKKGLRSGCAIERLRRLGFTDVVSLEGGLRAWHGAQVS